MRATNWMLTVLIAMTPIGASGQDRAFDDHQSVDGMVVHLGFESAAEAANWTGFHRSTDVDTTLHAVRSDLERHIVVVIENATSGARIEDARVKIKLMPVSTPGGALTRSLEPMARGSEASYGGTVTVDPDETYDLELTIQRRGRSGTSRVRFDAPRRD